MNTATDSADFEKSIRIPYQQDGFDDVRAEYSQMLRQQLSKGNNGLTKTKFLTYGIEGDSMAQVKPRLEHIQNDLMNNFHRLGVLAKPLDGTERLRLMHTYHETKSCFTWIGEIEDERLLSALENLKDEDLELLTRYAYEGYNTVELSKVYGIAQQNISKRILRITKFLKNFKFQGVE